MFSATGDTGVTTNPQNNIRAASQLPDMGRSCKEQRRREPGVTREGPLSRGLEGGKGQACDWLPTGKAAHLSEPARQGWKLEGLAGPGPGGSEDHGQDLRPVKPPESGTPGHNEARLQQGLSGDGVRMEAEWSQEPPAASQGAP